MKLLIINGSARAKQRSAQVANWAEAVAKDSELFDEVELVHVGELNLSFDMPDSDYGGGPKLENEAAKSWSSKVKNSDAILVVTPEYNHGYPAALKTAIDYLYSDWSHKPVGLVGHGGVGGARAIEGLLPVLRAVQLVPLRNEVRLTHDEATMEEDGSVKSERAGKMLLGTLTQLKAYAEGLKVARERLEQ